VASFVTNGGAEEAGFLLKERSATFVEDNKIVSCFESAQDGLARQLFNVLPKEIELEDFFDEPFDRNRLD
jgi:hypothetical protein